MKKRISAVILAVAVCLLGSAVFASEADVEKLTEAVPVQEAAGADTGEDASEYAQYFDNMKASVPTLLEQLSAMTDEQLDEIIDGTDAQSAKLAATWKGVKEELGVFVEAEEQSISEENDIITVETLAKYDGVPENTKVIVSYVADIKKNETTVDWDIRYPAGKLIAEAGLNTLLGMGTVFIVLIFLSFVIGNLHWIPDLVEKMKKSKQAPPAPAAAPAPVRAPAVEELPAEEEELAGDEELVAVIAAAIAAFNEGTEEVPADGLVIRSIRKANRRSVL